jgi:hypothetical protein
MKKKTITYTQVAITVAIWFFQILLFCQIPVDFTTNVFLSFVCMGLVFLGWVPYYFYFKNRNLKVTGEI